MLSTNHPDATETLVLVPGLGCTAALFSAQIEALSALVSVEVADHGSDDSLETIARRLLAASPERFSLAGLSMGGYVALEVMRGAPERVARLALLDTTARPDGAEARERRLRLIGLAEAGRLGEVHALLWPQLVHPDRIGDAALEEIVRGMVTNTGADAFIRQQQAILGRPDSRPLLPTLELPTLVLVGREDAITPVEVALEMSDALPDATLAIVERCGHLSTLERPEAVTAALGAWLARPAL